LTLTLGEVAIAAMSINERWAIYKALNCNFLITRKRFNDSLW